MKEYLYESKNKLCINKIEYIEKDGKCVFIFKFISRFRKKATGRINQ